MKASLNKKVVKEEEGVAVDEGFKAIDLTAEKRIELFVKNYQKFEKENIELLGVKLGVEQNYLPQAIVPKLVVIDLLKKDENKLQEATKV